MDLQIPSDHNHRRPVLRIGNVLDFQADLSVVAHPFDLLANRRKAVQAAALPVEGEMDGDDIGLVVTRASQASESAALQHLKAVVLAQLMNQHLRSLDLLADWSTIPTRGANVVELTDARASFHRVFRAAILSRIAFVYPSILSVVYPAARKQSRSC